MANANQRYTVLFLEGRQGNQQSYETLFGELRNNMFIFIYRLYKNADLADDAVQEASMKVWKNRGNIDPTKNIVNYFIAAAVNYVKDVMKKKSNYTAQHDDIHFNEHSQYISDSAFSNDELNEVFRKYQGAGKEELRIQLAYNIPLEVLADLQGVPTGTIKSRMDTGRKKIKETLEKKVA